MRKYLIVATAALTIIAVGAVAAVAQTPAASMKVTVKPRDAGTTSKPKNSSIKLTITNGDPKKTAKRLTITSPKTFHLSARGLTKCSATKIEQAGNSLTPCPRKSRVGRGTAHALVGVNGTSPFGLTFKVTAVVLGAKRLGFLLQGQELAVNVLAPATIKGRKLIVNIPAEAQQPQTGLWAGLVDLQATMKASKGTHYLASTTGCRNRKHKFSARLEFANNGVSDTTPVTTAASSACTK